MDKYEIKSFQSKKGFTSDYSIQVINIAKAVR